MQSRFIGAGLGLAVALGLARCAPGPGGYAGWSDLRQHQASEHAYRAQRESAQAQWQAEHGNYWGAQRSQAAANAEADQAQAAQDHAARDRWLSHF